MWMTVCLALLISTVFLKNFQSKKSQAIANFYQLKKFALIIILFSNSSTQLLAKIVIIGVCSH